MVKKEDAEDPQLTKGIAVTRRLAQNACWLYAAHH
jgi:hypothetical protein